MGKNEYIQSKNMQPLLFSNAEDKENKTMSYVTQAERAMAMDDYKNILTAGQLVYLLTLVLLNTWKENPTYNTLHELRKKFVTDPKNNPVLNKMRGELAGDFTVADIYTASAEAFHEFRARVGQLFLVTKVMENGDLQEYQEAMRVLEKQIDDAKARKNTLILPKT